MRLSFFTVILCLVSSVAFAQKEQQYMTKYELTEGTETVTYQEGIKYYQKLAKDFETIKMIEMGPTDSGEPLHLVLFDSDKQFDLEGIKTGEKGVFLINNAIHAGETDGIDASMMFLRDLAQKKVLKKESKNVVVAIIPFFNIGGVLNRNSTTRVNQNGPKEYGFRGNARNFNLNRDFTKADTRNMWSFWEIFHALDPDFFLDTHVSNGADYQYVITLIANQKDKLSPGLIEFQEEKMKPQIYKHMESAGFPMTPYVNVYGRKPDAGFSEFADWARYSSGFANLFQTYGFMTETHMLKPYQQRVPATYEFIHGMTKLLSDNKEAIQKARTTAREKLLGQSIFPLKWKLDSSRNSTLNFKGFEGEYIDSDLTQQKRLFYDRSKPFEKELTYWNSYKPTISAIAPEYYVIKKSWYQVIERLQANKVEMREIESDTSISAKTYKIKSMKSVSNSYEGHYYHYDIDLEEISMELSLSKGDILIPLNQDAKRYIIEMLEPLGEDSFLKWNFFDTVMERKEYFSSYVFEELAKKILEENPELEKQYRELQKSDENFSSNRYMQLDWIFKKSKHYEKVHLIYPVYRLN